MKTSPLLLSLALLGALSLSPLASAAEKVPTAKQVCTGLTKAAKKANDKTGAEAKGRLALAAAIKKLEKAPEDVNLRSKGKGLTPLMIATALGEKDAVRWLLTIGADPYIQDNDKKDSFARTQNKAITALLRKHSLATWEEALKHLESIPEKDWLDPADSTEKRFDSRADIMKACQQLSQGQESDIHPYSLAWDFTHLGDHKMLSFLARQGEKWNYHGMSSHYHAAVTSPYKEKRVAAFNLLESLACMGNHPGMQGMFWLEEPSLNDDAKVQRWLRGYLNASTCIELGAQFGLLNLVKQGISKAKSEKTETRLLQFYIAKGIAAAFTYDKDNVMAYLQTQDYGGMCLTWVYNSAFSDNKVEKFKKFMETRPRVIVEWDYATSSIKEVNEQEVLVESAWNLYGIEAYKYLMSLLKEPLPTRYDYRANMMRNVAFKQNVTQEDREFIKFMLEQGANPHSALEVVRDEELKKMLLEANDKKK